MEDEDTSVARAKDAPEEASLTRKDVMRQGWDRVRRSGAEVASIVLGEASARVVPRVQRPPGAIPTMDFLMACTRCDACIDACPPGAILRLADGAALASGTPFLDVEGHKPCTACPDVPCAQACPTGALLPIEIEDAWMGTAVLNRDTCLTWNDASCDACVRICPIGDSAILADDEGRVYIDARGCIGCGLCIVVCPTRPRSIEVDPPPLI